MWHSQRFPQVLFYLALGGLLLSPSLLVAQTEGAPYAWVPYLSRRIQTPIGTAIYNKLLWVWGTNTDRFGITAFDGNINYQGGRTVGMGVNTFHATGSGLYATVYANRTTVLPQSIRGTFQIAESVRQVSTGAKGVLVHNFPNQYILLCTTGKFNTSTITGDVSHAVLTPKSVTNDTSYFLERSMTGFDDFVPVLDVPYRLKMRGLVDCGKIKFSDKTTRLLLAFDDPIVEGQFAHVYYNLPDIDNNWKLLLDTTPVSGQKAIRHFHGAIWLPGKKAGTGRLIAMTGDTDTESSLLVCDDVADLIAHPGNWKTNWGLDRTGDDRVNYLRTKGKPYCIGAGTQEYRVIDILTDAEGKYGYYIPDTHTLTYLMQIDLQNKTAKPYGTRRAQGYGWMGLRLSNGIMLFGVASESTNFYYNGNSDQYAHLYAFKPGDADIVEVFKTLRADYKAPTITRGHFVNILEYNDAVWMLGNNLLDPVTVGMVADKSEIAQLQNEEADNLSDALNKLTNTDLLFGVGAFQSNQLRYWSPYRTSQSSDSTTVYSGRSPSTPSLLCEPIATTPGIAVTSLSLSQKVVNRMRGQWITVVAYVHTDLPNEQVGMSVYFGPVSGIQNTIKTTGGWDPITVTVFVPLNAQGMVLNLIPRLSGNSTTKVWFSNTYAMLGALPR